MRTRFWKLTALILALLLALTGCSLIEIDEEMDRAEVAAEVGGEKITKGDVLAAYNSQLNLYRSLYGTNDLPATVVDSIKDDVLEQFISVKLLNQKAKELNLSDFSDESFAEADQEAADYYETLIEQYSDAAATDEMSEEEAREATIAYLESYGVSLDAVKEDYRNNAVAELVREQAIADVTVTDEEIQTAYDEKVAEDETTYSSSGYLFELYNTYGYTIAWAPEGYRTVKHILFIPSDEQKNELSELENRLDEVNALISGLETAEETTEDAAEEPTEEAAEETAEDGQEAEEPTLSKEELTAEAADLEKQIEDKKAEILDSFKEKTDDVYARLDAGEDFDSLMAELGEDPGMKADPSMTTGYYVSAESTMWDAAFRDTAMALEKVGDVSEPILSGSGVHIIYYNSDVTPGPADIETLRDELSEELLSAKQDEAYNAQYEEWKQGANVKKYPKVLN